VTKLKKFDSLLIWSWPDGPFKRIRKTDVNLTRTMAWYEATRIGLGVMAAHKVERLLDPESCGKKDRANAQPRKWGTYYNGRSVPDLRMKDRNPIAQAEARVPSSVRWFLSPLWCALDDRKLNYRDLVTYLQSDPIIANALFRHREFNSFKISEINIENIADINQLSGIELLECIVLLLEIGRLSKSLHLMSNAFKLYVKRTSEIAQTAQLLDIFPRVLDHIEDRYLPTHYVLYDDDFIAPWRVREPQLYEPIAKMRLEELRQQYPEHGL
jgi:hypothetical protein